MTVEIPVSDVVGLVDDEDAEAISRFRWYVKPGPNTTYARARIDGRFHYMHRLLLLCSMVDHANGDGLDNRRSNLRPCTAAQNGANSGSRGGTSQFKGVYWSARSNRWLAKIKVNGRPHHVGTFIDEDRAALAYNEMAVEFFGEFARLNPVETE